MRKMLWIVLLATLLAGLVASPAAAQQGGGEIVSRDPAFEQEIYDRLAQIDPAAVPVFKTATEALDRGDVIAARQGFEEVLRLAPDFPDALRRLSYILAEQNDLDGAEALARKALQASDLPENQAALARILLNQNTPAGNQEALGLARQASARNPEDSSFVLLVVAASAMLNDVETMRPACAQLLRLDPNSPDGHYFNGLLAANDGKWLYAEDELLLSRKLGMPADVIQETLDQGISSQARIWRVLRGGLYGLAGWVGMLVVLFLIGLILSQVTLAAVNRRQRLTSAEIHPAERLVRRIYRLVIAVTGAYFYLSIPILVVLVIAAVGLIFYGFLMVGSIPVKLAIIILLAGLFTLYAVVRSLFLRRADADPGKELNRSDAFYLWQTLDDVARQLGARPVDRVFVTPGTNIGVYERGGWLDRLRGHGQRCLILGLGALPGMDQGQFRAIIAHEYGHFSNADTAGGDLANSVTFHIHSMAEGLARAGTAAWYNPVWLFLNGYNRIFLRVTQGASRLQEILADRYAAVKFGAQNLKTGLEHMVRQDLQFSFQVHQEVQTARTEQRGLSNLYTLRPVENEPDLETAFNKIMTSRTSPYDSHPAPCDRLEHLDRIQNPGFDQYDPRPVWDLLSSSLTLQQEMTDQVMSNIRDQGNAWPVAAQPVEAQPEQTPA